MTGRAVRSLASGKIVLVRSRAFWLRVVLGVFVLLNCRVFAIMIRTELSGSAFANLSGCPDGH